MILTSAPPELIKSCKIGAEARDYGISLIKKGVSLLEVAEKVEKKIFELGGEIAFPPQISLNHIAAHYCPDANDKTVFGDDLAKLDVGVQIEGYIADTARSIDLSGKYGKIIQASEDALKAAIKIVKPGTTLGQIGKVIQDTIAAHGLSPVRNLSGHGLGMYDIHTEPNIPNYDNGDDTELQKGQLIAIEPFATDGAGLIQEGNSPTLFSIATRRQVRLPVTRKILKYILENYGQLVFAKRWLKRKFQNYEVEFALRNLEREGIIHGYPPLGELKKGIVSQTEHTILVGYGVLTKSSSTKI